MNNNEVSLVLQGLLGNRKSLRRYQRKIEGKEPRDPTTIAVLGEYRERLSNLVAFLRNQPLPNCPKCGTRLFFEAEIREDARIVCRAGHSTEVVRISASKIWVRADFFQLE